MNNPGESIPATNVQYEEGCSGRTEREELVLRFMMAYAAAGYCNDLLYYALEGTDTFLKWCEEQRNADR